MQNVFFLKKDDGDETVSSGLYPLMQLQYYLCILCYIIGNVGYLHLQQADKKIVFVNFYLFSFTKEFAQVKMYKTS